MILEFRKLNFAKLEYPKSDTLLHIFEIVINYNILCENVLFGYFRRCYGVLI